MAEMMAGPAAEPNILSLRTSTSTAPFKKAYRGAYQIFHSLIVGRRVPINNLRHACHHGIFRRQDTLTAYLVALLLERLLDLC